MRRVSAHFFQASESSPLFRVGRARVCSIGCACNSLSHLATTNSSRSCSTMRPHRGRGSRTRRALARPRPQRPAAATRAARSTTAALGSLGRHLRAQGGPGRRLRSTSHGSRSWRTGARSARSTSGCRRRGLARAAAWAGCRTACRAPRCSRSMRGWRGPSRRPGRTRRSSSCGGRGSARTSSRRATARSSRSGGCRTSQGPAARRGHRRSPARVPRRPADAIRRGRARARRRSQRAALRGADGHGPDPLGGRASAGDLDRAATRASIRGRAAGARAPVPARLRADHARGVRRVGRDRAPPRADAAFDALAGELLPVRTPIGDAVDPVGRRAELPGRALPRSAGATAPERRHVLPAPGCRSGAARPRGRSSRRAVDLARLARCACWSGARSSGPGGERRPR